MNNRGFISISLVYSFFLVFLLLLLFIVNGYVNNRSLLKNVKTEIKNDISDTNFARYLVNHSEELDLIKHDDSVENGALDNSYRYTGSNPSNYVCFGSSSTTCPNSNLYRIIGVIGGKVKLIKNYSIGLYNYDNTDTSTYVNTRIYSYLNNDFLNSLGDYANIIEPVTWYVGGLDYTVTSLKIREIYDKELGLNKNNGVTVNAKIGLPYLSEYGYAKDISSYNGTVNNTNNWLYSANAWFITRVNNYTNQAFYINDAGSIGYATVDNSKNIRPTFSLKRIVKKIGGSGTSDDPYRIGW